MIARILALSALALAVVMAQKAEDPEKSKVPPRSLRLLPLGEPPPFRQEVRDGVRYELEPTPGSIPPRQIRLVEGTSGTIIRLNLGRASEPVKIPVGTAPTLFREGSATVDPASPPWITLHPPKTGDILAVLWRDPGTSWSKPRSIIYPDSSTDFPAGNIRIINLLPTETALILGSERAILLPGKSLLKPIAIGVDLPIQIAFKTNTGEFQRFYYGSVLLNQNERAQIFIHRADGEKPRQPAKVVIFSEGAPAIPSPQH